MIKLYFLTICSVVFCLTGCLKVDDTQSGDISNPELLILNEGNFNRANASVSLIDLDSNAARNNVFFDANEFPLGDIAQSVFVNGDTAFIIVNNSGKIEVVNLQTLERLGVIEGLNSPRYAAKIGDQLYVTELFNDVLYQIDLNSLSLTRTISVNQRFEDIHAINNQLYVYTPGDLLFGGTQQGGIFQLDMNSGAQQAVFVPRSQHAYTTANFLGDFCFVATYSDTLEQANLYRLNQNGAVLDSFINFAHQPISRIDYLEHNLVVVSGNTVQLFTLNQNELQLIGEAEFQAPYQVHLSKHGFLFVAEAFDYNRNGKIVQFDLNMNQLNEYEVGIIPQFMLDL